MKAKSLFSIKTSSYLSKAKAYDVFKEGQYINIVDDEQGDKIVCTLFKSLFPTRDTIFWESPIAEMKPYKLANILEVWENFDFYFKTLNQ